VAYCGVTERVGDETPGPLVVFLGSLSQATEGASNGPERCGTPAAVGSGRAARAVT